MARSQATASDRRGVTDKQRNRGVATGLFALAVGVGGCPPVLAAGAGEAGRGAEAACACLSAQVWFQNRRMKDKRQRLAMSWPHPADPSFYTYMMTHAAATGSLPYPFHSHVPLHYYPHVGVTAAAAAAAASGAAAAPFATSIRPLDTFRALSHPYSRPELLCSFRHPGLYQAPAAAGLNSSAAASAAAAAAAAAAAGSGPPGGSAPCSCLSCHSSQTAAAAAAAASALGSRGSSAADFPCTAAGQRSESGFLPYSAAVLSKAAVASPDQREEAPLTR